MNFKRSTLLCVFGFCFCTAFSQSKYTGERAGRVVHVNMPTKRIDATVNTSRKPTPIPDIRYSWYDNAVIHETQGGYAGYVLDGPYAEYYIAGNNLSAQGIYGSGIKKGRWSCWYANGNLRERVKWKDGRPNGKRYLYDTAGVVVRIEKYRDGLLNGRTVDLDASGLKRFEYYRAGDRVQHKSVAEFIASRFERKEHRKNMVKEATSGTKTGRELNAGKKKQGKLFLKLVQPVKNLFRKKSKKK